MPCLVGCFALFFPRVALILIWLLSDYLEQAYAGMSVLWPILNFFFLPLTTLAYAFAWHMNPQHTIDGLGIVVIIIAVLIDIGTWGGSASHREVRKYYVVRRAD